jgi:hypothetical protein
VEVLETWEFDDDHGLKLGVTSGTPYKVPN